MAENIESNLTSLFSGLGFEENTEELCDFTLAEQNAALECQGVQPSAASDFVPVLGKSVVYIVACVIVNDQNQVLMMQEAKKSCSGKWYLPAGRMENNESIVDAAVREVLEETGLHIQITTMLAVECAAGSWYRFVLTGSVVGGELKKPNQADEESLQAMWVTSLDEVELRSNDILQIVELGKSYHMNKKSPGAWHSNILPVRRAHSKNFLRIMAVIKKRSTNKVHVLLSEKNAHHLPNVEIHPGRSIHSTLRKFLIELFGADLPQHRPHGILSVEHSPASSTGVSSSDGICITVLVPFRPALEEVTFLGKCVWQELSSELGNNLTTMLASKHSTVALHVVR